MTQTLDSLKKPTWSPTPAHSEACHELEVNATLGTTYGGEEFPLTAHLFLVRLSSMMAVVSAYAGSTATASAFSVQVSAQVVLTSTNICLIWFWIPIFC